MNKEISYSDAIKAAGVVLVEFYAVWCPHCQRMAPVVEHVKEQLNGQVPVYQYDIDKNEADADAAGVEIVPTFIIYDNNRETWRHAGEITGEELLAAVHASKHA